MSSMNLKIQQNKKGLKVDISEQIAMEFRGLVTDKFKELNKDKLTKALAEIISDTAFLLCVSEVVFRKKNLLNKFKMSNCRELCELLHQIKRRNKSLPRGLRIWN